MEACTILLQKIELLSETEDAFADIAQLDENYYSSRNLSLLAEFEDIVCVKDDRQLESTLQCLKAIYEDILSGECSSAKRKTVFEILTSIFKNQGNDTIINSIGFYLFDIVKRNIGQKECKDAVVETFKWLEKLVCLSTYKNCQVLLSNIFQLIDAFPNVDKPDKVSRAILKVLKKLLSRNEPVMPSYQIYRYMYAIFEMVKQNDQCPLEAKSIFSPLIWGFHSSFRKLSRVLSIQGRRYLYPIIQHSQCINNKPINNKPSPCSFTPHHYKVESTSLIIKMSESAMCLDPDLREPRFELIANCLLQPYCVHILERALLRPESSAQPDERNEDRQSQSSAASTPNLLQSKSTINGLETVLTNLLEEMILDDDASSRKWTNLITNIQLLILKNQAIKVQIFMNAVVNALKRTQPKIKLGANARKLYFMLVSFVTIVTLNPTIQIGEETLNRLIEIDEALSASFSMNCFNLDSASLEDISRAILWFKLKARTHALNHSEVDFPRELQFAQNDVQQAFQSMNKEMKVSLFVKLLNFSNYSDAQSNQMQKRLIAEFLNSPSQTPVKLIGNVMACGQIGPIDFKSLSNLTMALRIVLFQQFSTHWKQLMPQFEKPIVPGGPLVLFPSPAFVETYGRLFMDTFFDTFYQPAISLDSVIQAANQHNAHRTILVCAEIFVNLLPRANMSYFFAFCSHCIHLTKNRLKYSECTQFHLSLESALIQMMSCFGVKNFIAIVEKYNATNTIGNLISPDNEDYNKLFMLNVARCMHIAGVDCFDKSYKSFFDLIQGKTPHMLAHHMLHNMPAQLIALYQNQPFFQPEVNQKLKQDVENEYHNFLKLLNRPNNEVLGYISQMKGHYFLCFFYKLLLSEDNQFKPPPLICAAILEQIGPRNLTKHIQTFCDLVNYEILTNGQKGSSKFIDVISKMIWEYNVMPIDRFIVAFMLRPFGQKDDQVALFAVHLLLQASHELKERITFFCDLVDKTNINDPEIAGGWFANWQYPYIQKYEEKFHYDGIHRAHNVENQNKFFFPTYFSNLCVRFVPVFELVVTRFLEIPLVFKHLPSLLGNYGRIFRLHKLPITFLYKTVAYYKKVIEPEGARLLIMTVFEAFKSVKPAEWLVSEEFLENARSTDTFKLWNPATSYLNSLIEKLSQAVFTPSKCEPFCRFNWEMEEFTSVASHVIYSVCLEILCLPNMAPVTVVGHLFELAFNIESDVFNKFQRLNIVSLILNHLPPIYYSCIETSVLEVINSPTLRQISPDEVLEMCLCKDMKFNEMSCAVLKAQYLYYHANTSHLNLARQFLSDQVKPMVKTEQQLLLYCHLLAPFFLIYSDNKPIQKQLYSDVIELMPIVAESKPNNQKTLIYEDLFVDLLYFGKYTCIGDDLKPLVDKNALLCGQLMPKKMKFF